MMYRHSNAEMSRLRLACENNEEGQRQGSRSSRSSQRCEHEIKFVTLNSFCSPVELSQLNPFKMSQIILLSEQTKFKWHPSRIRADYPFSIQPACLIDLLNQDWQTSVTASNLAEQHFYKPSGNYVRHMHDLWFGDLYSFKAKHRALVMANFC